MTYERKRLLRVSCRVEVEHSAESLHAHVELDGVNVGPGDRVVVHDAPTLVPLGERKTFHCQATVARAGAIGRLAAHVKGYLELTELYEVGFSEGRAT
jgi:hypothetical protein